MSAKHLVLTKCCLCTSTASRHTVSAACLRMPCIQSEGRKCKGRCIEMRCIREKPKAGRNHVLILVFLATHKQIQLLIDAQSVLLADATCSEQRQHLKYTYRHREQMRYECSVHSATKCCWSFHFLPCTNSICKDKYRYREQMQMSNAGCSHLLLVLVLLAMEEGVQHSVVIHVFQDSRC